MGSTRGTISLWTTLALVLFYSCCVGILSVQAGDPDPLVDVAPEANETFVLRNVYENGDVSIGPGGLRAALNISIFPALKSEGITYVHFRMKPCGENLPHTHPRATELLTVVSGGPIQAGVVNTSGDPHIYVLYPGDIIVFPRGLLHFELNIGGEEAFYISALNSQNPGTLTSQTALFNLPTRTAAGALNQDFKTTERLKAEIISYGPRLQHVSKQMGCVPNQDITTKF